MADGLAARAWRAAGSVAAAVVGGATNFLGRAEAGLSASTVADLGRALVGVGVSAAFAPVRLVSDIREGFAAAGLFTGQFLPAVAEAFAASTRLTCTDFARVGDGQEIVQVTYNLTHRRGAATAASSGTGAWTSPTNAQGAANGTNATHAGNLTTAHDTRLTCSFDDLIDKTALTLVTVRLHFYVEQTGTVLNNGDLRLYRGDAVAADAALLETITGDVSSLVTPRTFDVTANYPTWASLNDLRAQVRHLTDVGEVAVIASTDAVELEIVAAHTQAV